MSKLDQFKSLHENFFVLPNVWDAKSAMRMEEEKYPALATSSAAVAGSLGYADGEEMSFHTYLFIITRILSSVHIPLSVDLETGYGGTDEEISNNVLSLARLGVVGINIEDSIIGRPGRTLNDAATFAKTIETVRNRLQTENLDLFINIRCDTYILNREKETLDRLKTYENCGANGIFLPCILEEQDIARAVQATKLPLNVMYLPDLPDQQTLQQLGVKRLSLGPHLFNKPYAALDKVSLEFA